MKILFIGARLFDDVALYAKKHGITTILTDSNPKSPNLKLSDRHYLVSRGMEEPKKIALKEDVDAVVPLIGVDGPLLEVAMMKEELEKSHGLPVVASGVKATSISVDKFKTKQFLLKNNIKTPEFSKISKNDLERWGNEPDIPTPVVLKQSHGQGGYGIKIAFSPLDIQEYFNQFDQAMLEEFLDGLEVSIEVLRWNGKSIPLVPVYKGRTTLEGIHPLNKIKKAPLEIENLDNESHNQEIRGIAHRITDLLGVEGTADLDLIFDTREKQNYVIEINTRPSGTRYLTTASTAINPLQELVNMATGSWKVSKIKKRMKKYFALEIPVGDYDHAPKNFKFSEMPEKSCWIIHGPENHQRVTIRANNELEAFKTAEKLKII
jgi:carbamoylphosphate synthase large subunit